MICTHFAVVWPVIVATAPGGIFSFHVPIVLFVFGSVAVTVMFLAFGWMYVRYTVAWNCPRCLAFIMHAGLNGSILCTSTRGIFTYVKKDIVARTIRPSMRIMYA